MYHQKTLKSKVELEGKEPFGGQLVYIGMAPAPENTGIVFRSENREVKACLQNARATMCTTAIRNKELCVLNAEHLLATINWGYGISNAYINISTTYSKSRKLFKNLGLARNTEVIPYFYPGLQKVICKAIESVGIKVQEAEEKTNKLEKRIETKNLLFEPIKGNNLEFHVITNYPGIGEQTRDMIVNTENYKQIADARSYAKHVSPEKVKIRGLGKNIPRFLAKFLDLDTTGSTLAKYLCYPWLGFSHGFSRDANFFPPATKGKWEYMERMPAEIGAHSIIDGLGKLALTEKRLIGARITCRFAGHKDYMRLLKKYFR